MKSGSASLVLEDTTVLFRPGLSTCARLGFAISAQDVLVPFFVTVVFSLCCEMFCLIVGSVVLLVTGFGL